MTSKEYNSWLLVTVSTSVLLCVVAVIVYVASKNYLEAANAEGRLAVLSEKVARAEMIVEAVPVGVAVYEFATANLIKANHEFAQLVGRDKPSMIGMPATALLWDKEYRSEVARRIIEEREQRWAEIQQRPLVNEDLRIARPDGLVVYCRSEIRGVIVAGQKQWVQILTELPEVKSDAD